MKIIIGETFDKERKLVEKMCIDRYGRHAQIDMGIEGMSELTKALLKYRRNIKYQYNEKDINTNKM